MVVQKHDIGEAMKKLNQDFGGNWVFVETINPSVEVIKFDDGLIYRGFDGVRERYSDAIKTLSK